MVSILRAYLWRNRPPTVYTVISIGFLLAIIGGGLISCGSNSGVGSSPNSTSTPARLQQCGSVQTNPRGVPVNGLGTKQAEDCFWQAYQLCQTASLSFVTTGVDTIVKRTFTIKNNGGQCLVTDAVQHAIVPAPLPVPSTSTCTGITRSADGLHFSNCGADGNVVVPL